MKASEITVGGQYRCRVSNRIVTVVVLEILDGERRVRGDTWRRTTRYRCQSLATGREIVVRSAQRFRGPDPDDKRTPIIGKSGRVIGHIT